MGKINIYDPVGNSIGDTDKIELVEMLQAINAATQPLHQMLPTGGVDNAAQLQAVLDAGKKISEAIQDAALRLAASDGTNTKWLVDADAIIEELNKLPRVKVPGFESIAVDIWSRNPKELPKETTIPIRECVRLDEVIAIIEKARLRG